MFILGIIVGVLLSIAVRWLYIRWQCSKMY
jgi:hypothetical protein